MKDILKFSTYNPGLNLSVESVKGVGAKRGKLLGRMGIETLGDALFHFPRRYEDRRRIKRISETVPGQVEVIRGTIAQVETTKARKVYIIKALLVDGQAQMTAVWFNQRHLLKRLTKGKEIVVVGKVQQKFYQSEVLVQEFEEASEGNLSGRILPVYPGTTGLPQSLFRDLAEAAIKHVTEIPDRVPGFLRQKYHLPEISQALECLHCPEDFEQLEASRKRMIFEELFLHQYYLSRRSQATKSSTPGVAHTKPNHLKSPLLQSLEFGLTCDQARVTQEIENDMENPVPMRRLLQGDVGSGKTLVAILAMLKAVSNGCQAAFMVPTEILADQHHIYLVSRLEGLGVKVKLLTGNVTGAARKDILAGVAQGTVDILVGTQALIQGQIMFHRLGLVVIDEQHRFGVVQRMQLTDLEPSPDVLVMTATPIPRSLELTFYGDLDLSVIKEMPPGRKKIFTRYVAEKERHKLNKFLKDSIEEGRQAYVVCPLIEESETLEIAAAEDIAQKLSTEVLPEYRVELLHGKMKSNEKEQIMREFKDKKISVLVSTTVIEVGIDVPNATIIVIEGCERFGLAQLHQLRGRVGRGPLQSFCFLLGNPATEEAVARLKAMLASNSGFEIAEKDLEIRGPGDLLGTKQHGLPAFQIADPVRDVHWAAVINKEIKAMEADGFQGSPEELQLLDACCGDIMERFAAN